MRMGTIHFLAISLFILLSISQANGQYSQSNSPGAVAASRVVPLTIKVVLLGFSNTDLNSSYLTSGINSFPVKYQQVLQGPINTGVMYNFTYQYVYEEASSALVQSFARYVNSTGKEQDTVPGTPPPFFGNPALNKTSTKVSLVQNYFYDANKVENWLISNQTLFGAIPNPGYTLFISDLNRTIIPSLSFQQYQVAITKCSCNSTMAVQAHYYNRTVTDPDLGLSLPRHYMTSWVGTGRIYYTDLSAGTSYWTNELPMQVAAGARGVNLSTPYGRIWAAEFVNDYISGAVYNLFAADQLYPVTYAQRYNFQLFVFDNRTDAEKAKGPKISTTLNTTMVQNQLASLLPFATVTVSAKFSDITAYPQLAAVVANATTKVKDPALSIPIVDARLVWNWLSLYGKGHMTQFINATHTTSQYDIPGFLFAFQGNYTFAFTFKENIELSEPPGSIGGVALAATGNSLINSGTIAIANREMALANQHYSTMDYAGAVQHSLAAALSALQAEQSGSLFSSGLVFGLIGLAVGVAAGLLLGFLFFRKRKVTTAVGYNRCPTCQQPVRWDPVQMKWYCDRCQKPV